jgi:hypothetical protein
VTKKRVYIGRVSAFPGKTERKTVSLTPAAVAIVATLRARRGEQSDSDLVERAIRQYGARNGVRP